MRVSDWSSDVCSSDLPCHSGPLRSGGGGGQDPQGAAQGCAAFSAGAGCPSENPAGSANPVQRAGREGGVCFFAPGFFAHAKKGDSRRHGAKALDLCVAVVRQEEEQEQLAALAPLIRPAGRSEEHTSELQSLMRT